MILDIFSRRVVGRYVANAESAALFRPLFDDAIDKHNVPLGQLTLHADRGGPMKARATALLLADLGVTRSHNRPHTSNDNPFSESHFKTLKHQPRFPQRFGCIEDAKSFCRRFFDWYNQDHHHAGIGLMTPDDTGPSALRPGRCRPRRPSAHPRSGAPGNPGALRQQAAHAARQTNRRLDQPAHAEQPHLIAAPDAEAIVEALHVFPRLASCLSPAAVAILCDTSYGPALIASRHVTPKQPSRPGV